MRYEIIDDNGVIHASDNREDMEYAFAVMTDSYDHYSEEEKEEYGTEWEGDIKLVEVIYIDR